MRRGIWVAAALLAAAPGCAVPTPAGSAPGPVDARLREALEAHVRALAEGVGERHVRRPEALARAARYVEDALGRYGYRVSAQEYEADGVAVRNLVAERPGAGPEVVVVGAHYDTAPGTPGANDNGSGVAALLELARLLGPGRTARAVRFVAFANEEPPFFQGPLMGSRVYARGCRERGDRVHAMLSLETLGYYDDRPGSQRYPFPFSLFYPSTGNFLAFVGNLSSAGAVREAAGSFRRASTLPAEWAAVPAWVPGVDLSDHRSFWEEGYRAVLVTDTAMFRYPWYHTAGDAPERLDFDRLARATAGLEKAVTALAGPAAPSP